MAIIDKIKAKAKADIKHIVLPEGEEIRNVQAAVMIRDQGLAKLTLLGNPAKVKEVAAGADLTGIDIIDPADSDKAPLYAATLYDLRKAKGMTEEEAAARLLSLRAYRPEGERLSGSPPRHASSAHGHWRRVPSAVRHRHRGPAPGG